MSHSLADPEQTKNRLEILNRFFRGMLLLNGGGCVALLAFLQAIWKDAGPGFVRGIVAGMVFFIVGLGFTVAAQYLRYEISKAIQFGRRFGRRLQRVYFWLVILSGLAFIVGAGWTVGTVWNFAEEAPVRVQPSASQR
jgi:hypothetical protein